MIKDIGERPHSKVGLDWPALFRGEGVGGPKKNGEFRGWDLDFKGRMPDDTKMRPTAVPG